MTEMSVEFGVEWVSGDGHRFVAAGYTESAARSRFGVAGSAARSLAAECAGKGWSPRAGRAMRRVVGEWFPIDEAESV